MKPKSEEKGKSMVEMYYKRIVRFVEYYIFFCFVLITVIPLLEYSWVQPFTRFIYFTGFPLLLLLLIVSLVRDPLIEFLKRKYETSEQPAREKTTRKK